MPDIKRKKPKVINLRKKKIISISTPTKLEIKETPPETIAASLSEVIGDFSCIDCGARVSRELTRCASCIVNHEKLVKDLDSRPKSPRVEKVKQEWIVQRSIKNGVPMRVFMTKQEAQMMGIRVE